MICSRVDTKDAITTLYTLSFSISNVSLTICYVGSGLTWAEGCKDVALIAGWCMQGWCMSICATYWLVSPRKWGQSPLSQKILHTCLYHDVYRLFWCILHWYLLYLLSMRSNSPVSSMPTTRATVLVLTDPLSTLNTYCVLLTVFVPAQVMKC